jgi:DNA polymerase I-like protein with 3'-5' exonuclease and polymerase domains
LILEVDQRDLDATAALVKDAMEGAADMTVPLLTEMRAGPNWDDMHAIGPAAGNDERDDVPV